MAGAYGSVKRDGLWGVCGDGGGRHSVIPSAARDLQFDRHTADPSLTLGMTCYFNSLYQASNAR
jgi:hypothetical protein